MPPSESKEEGRWYFKYINDLEDGNGFPVEAIAAQHLPKIFAEHRKLVKDQILAELDARIELLRNNAENAPNLRENECINGGKNALISLYSYINICV